MHDTVAECIIFYYLFFLSPPFSLHLLPWTKGSPAFSSSPPKSPGRNEGKWTPIYYQTNFLSSRPENHGRKEGQQHPYTTKPISRLLYPKAMNEKEDTALQISGKITQFYFPEPNHPVLYKSQRLFVTLIWFFCVDFPAYSPSSSSLSSQYDFCLIKFLIEKEKV